MNNNELDEKIDLIYIETELFSLTIKGKPVHPKSGALGLKDIQGGVEISLELPGDLRDELNFEYFDRESDELVQAEFLTAKSAPLFYEYQDYDIYIEGKKDVSLDFYHDNREIRQSVSSPHNDGRKLYGSLNFGSDIGLSEMEIVSDDRFLCGLTIEVFPSKIDYQQDYHKLLEEVNQEVYNLAYDFLRRTYQEMHPREADSPTDSEFFMILREIFDDLIKAFNRIKSAPHHGLEKTRKVEPAARVKDIDRQSVKWLNKNSQYFHEELQVPAKMLNVEKKTSFDTFENKFVRWLFQKLISRLNNFINKYERLRRVTDERIIEEIEKMQRKLEFNIEQSFLAGVGNLNKLNSLSLVLQMAPGYRELYKLYLILLKGLTLQGRIYELSMKELWEIYEYWAFLKLNQLLRDNEKYEMKKHDLIDLDYRSINVTLRKGSQSEVRYENLETGENFVLSYNKRIKSSATTGQRPDNILSLNKTESSVKYHFVFDAKYRVNPGKEGEVPGPEEEDINTMHRYKDAIISNLNEKRRDNSRVIVGAYVLFPYHEEQEYRKNSDFYDSIERVNVGAFPFLPEHTELVSDFLDEIIGESAFTNYERNLMPAGSEDYRDKMDFEQNVLIGSLDKNKAHSQYKYLLDNNLYYVPYQESVLNKTLNYVGFYKAQEHFPDGEEGLRYYGEVESIDVWPRSKIDIPSNSGTDACIVFKVKNWEELSRPVFADGYGISSSHIYTNFMLLQKADTLSELSISSLQEWRIWLELKRFARESEYVVEGEDRGGIFREKSFTGFKERKLKIFVRGERLIINELESDKILVDKKLQKFLANPRIILNELKGLE